MSRLIALMCALVLTLSLTTNAFATSLTNGDFQVQLRGGYHACSLSGWTVSGDVSVVNGTSMLSGDSCAAKAYSEPSSGSAPTYLVRSTLSQTFQVPSDYHYLVATIWATSENGVLPGYSEAGITFFPQFVGVYNSSDQLICGGSHNYDSNVASQYGLFNCDLLTYTGQTVTFKVSVTTSRILTASPDEATLFVDNVHFAPGVPYLGGGIYGW